MNHERPFPVAVGELMVCANQVSGDDFAAVEKGAEHRCPEETFRFHSSLGHDAFVLETGGVEMSTTFFAF